MEPVPEEACGRNRKVHRPDRLGILGSLCAPNSIALECSAKPEGRSLSTASTLDNNNSIDLKGKELVEGLNFVALQLGKAEELEEPRISCSSV